MKNERAEIEQQLKQLTDYVRDCDRRVAQGEVMDLQGLDRNVMVICDRVALLPPGEAKIIEPKLATMIEELEKLADTLRKQQGIVDQQEQTGAR